MATTKKSEAKINGSNYKRSKKHVQKKKISAQVPLQE